MSVVYLDECGFTGQDLLNPDQPILTIATLYKTEETCKELKDRFFNKVQSSELKYVSLSKRPRQRKMILEFLRELAKHPSSIKFSVSHKRYVLAIQMIEILVEPAAHEAGIDLYARGQNIALANILYNAIPIFGGSEFFEDLLTHFQEMIRNRTYESYEQFFRPLFENVFNKDLNSLLNYIRIGHTKLGYEKIFDNPHHLDPTLSIVLSLISDWRKELGCNLTLIHDRSSSMARNQDFWDALVDTSLPHIEVGYDSRRMSYPIGVEKTYSENSENWSGLQLVDILAGAYTRAVRWWHKKKDPKDRFGAELAEIFEVFADSSVFPCTTFLWPTGATTPEELGTVGEDAANPIDYAGNIIMRYLAQKRT